jgi:hypothetical protein
MGEILTSRSWRPPARWNGSFASELRHLDKDVNGLGLEIVPAPERTHLIRRCR